MPADLQRSLRLPHAFFGADHMVFATDTPYDNELGARVHRETIAAVQAMPIDDAERVKIFEGSARLFRLEQPAAKLSDGLQDTENRPQRH